MPEDYEKNKSQENKDETADSATGTSEKGGEEILKNLIESDQKGAVIIQNLNIINKNEGIVTGNHANLQEIDIHQNDNINTEQKQNYTGDVNCFIANRDELMTWLTEHYEDYEMAFIIAFAVFEKMPYLWIYTMAGELYELLDPKTEDNYPIKEKIANTNRINSIGGTTYQGIVYNHTGKTENTFICFESAAYSRNILECVWKEYIFLREKLIKWLSEYISDQNYSKAIRAIKALALFAQLEFDYFNKEVFPKLFLRKNIMSDYAIAQISLQINQNEKYKKNIENLYKYWAKTPNIHCLLTALIVGAANKWTQSIMGIAIERYLHQLIHAINNNALTEYASNVPAFISIGQRKAVYYKAIVSVLYDKLNMYKEQKYRHLRTSVGSCFLFLLYEDYRQSNIDVHNPENHKDMVFVKMCLINNDMTFKIRQLWHFLWTNRELISNTQALLEQYLYQYGGCSLQQVINLRKFLYSFLDTEYEKANMDFFLRKIAMRRNRPVLVAEKIIHIPEQMRRQEHE